MKVKIPLILKNALMYGLILGALFIVISLVTYITNLNIFSIWFSILNFLVVVLAIPLTFAVVGTNNLRLKHTEDHSITYLDSAVNCFILLITGLLMSNLYTFIFFQYIDPEYLKQMSDKVVEMMRSYNVDQERIDKTLADIDKGFQIGRQLLWTLGIALAGSLVLSIFIRKKDKLKESVY